MDAVSVELVVIAILIILNGFFACSEFAIISIRKSRVAQLVAAGDERAMIIEALQKDPHRLLAIVQIGVTVVGSTASAVGGIIAAEHLKPLLQRAPYKLISDAAEPLAISIVVIVVSYMSLIIGELVPKTIGLQYADTMALRIAKPLNLLARISTLAVSFLTISTKAVLSIIGVKGGEGRAFITREEVQHIVAEGHETGVFSAAESEYIRNIFDFTHTSVREVMVPRTRMAALDLDLSRKEMLEFVLENEYTRYPVFHGSVENIAGVVHLKDLLGRIVTEPDFDINTIIRTPFYVPEGKRVNDLLKEMQRKRTHMALVVDEYGGLSGLVTTEDLLEELVGEIEDEHDIGPGRVQRLPDGSLMVDALISINDVEDLLGIKLPEDIPYDTLAGLILDQLGRFPEKGERVEWHDYTLVCEEVKKTSIVKVRIVGKNGE